VIRIGFLCSSGPAKHSAIVVFGLGEFCLMREKTAKEAGHTPTKDTPAPQTAQPGIDSLFFFAAISFGLSALARL